ncbi:uncharacterized protein LOC144095057 [Amblyomma americanum]
MQVFAFVANALLPALLALPPASTSSTAVYCSDDRIFAWPQPDVITSSCPAAPPPGYHFPGPSWKASSPATSATGYISSDRPPSPLCGLGGCASVHTTNPFVYIMQVSYPHSLYAKRSSNYFLVQLPSPQCCIFLVLECAHVVRCLLILAGDIETNPGPNNLEAVFAELKKLSAGQTQLISEVQGLKNQLISTDGAIAGLSKRMTDLETHLEAMTAIKSELEIIKSENTRLSRQIETLEARIDDSENRSRRNNLIFYGIPDSNPSETFADSEGEVIRHCAQHLSLTIHPEEVERAHRLGRHEPNRSRPIIVKFISYKTKDTILSNGRKFKGTKFSVGEDFSHRVRSVRKQLVTFAKANSDKFALRYKTLHIGPRRYIFDEISQTVKEITIATPQSD